MHRLTDTALGSFAVWLIAVSNVAAAVPSQQYSDRRALVAALEALIATGEPRHTDHDSGESLQLAVDEAIARGDREIERLAVRAASPLSAFVSRPVSSTSDLPSISLAAGSMLRLSHPIPYRAQIYASVDGGEFVRTSVVHSGKSEGITIGRALPGPAGMPGFHVVQLTAHLTFRGTTQSGAAAAWTESRTLPPVFYGLYDPVAESSAPMRALVYGPAVTPARQLDPLLGDEPFGAWLNAQLASNGGEKDSASDWRSEYCDARLGEAGARSAARAICAVVGFQARGEIGQIWFRTAELSETEKGPEWTRLTPPRVEGMVISNSSQQSGPLSLLPMLLAADRAQPVGDVTISPADIVITPATFQAGALIDVKITVHNAGDGDLHKAVVDITLGTDLGSRGTSRHFVVDIPAHESTDLKVQGAFPAGYGYVLAHALQLGEHGPHQDWVPDPTPENACAIMVANPRRAPANYLETLLIDAGGCSGQ